ncbi:tyrosinase family protein [Ktedonospora formicarum]|uniref:Tyrosinase copper-binding domain-containing protein n=1 Tax=Ktedonospora formicarum TaxID=2778364 RepID=A0A8J3MXC0_9CHLR|nr:tyrosinase family protein [Ktedonospora formicarum]GHO49826.1 hypothetical protein KSX_79890 [Ktedonospora formicarum]
MTQAKIKIRRNIYSLTSTQIDKLIQAIKGLKATKDYDTYVETHSDKSVVDLVHGQPLFLPWHRAFLWRFEQQLNLDFGLPYWDWTDDRGQTDGKGKVTNRGPLWQANVWGGAGFPVKDGPFTVANGWETVPITVGTLSFDKQLLRGLSLAPSFGTYPTQEDIRRLFAFRPAYDPSIYDSFREEIEFGPHGYMHTWVGGLNNTNPTTSNSGHMSFFETSVNDPIFWLHHANIDRLWAQWQRLFPKSPVQAPGMDGNTYMPPTFGKDGQMYVKDVLDLSKLSYLYEEPQQVSATFRGTDTPPPYIDYDKFFYTTSTSLKQGEAFVWPTTAPTKNTNTSSDAGPALAYIHAKREAINAFRGEDGNEDLFTSTQVAGGTWTAKSSFETNGQGSYKSAGELGLAWFKEKLYCVYRGPGGDEQLYVTARDQKGIWSLATPLNGSGLNYSNSGAALAVYNNTLYCVHAGARNHDDFLWWSSTTDGVTWTQDQQFPGSYSIARPALAVLRERLYCVHRGGRGSDGNQLHWTQLIATATGLSWEVSNALPNHIIDDGPGLAIWEGVEQRKPTDPPQLVQRLVCLYRTPDKLAGLRYATAKVESNYILSWSPEQPAKGTTQASPALFTGPLALK